MEKNLELAMQELEPMEAPLWGTIIGVVVSAGAAYGTVAWAVSSAAVT